MKQRHLLERAKLMSAAFRLADVVIVVGCGLLIYILRKGWPIEGGYYPLFILLLAFLTSNIFSLFAVYRVWRGRWLYRELARVSLAWLTVVLVAGLLLFVTKTGAELSRLWAGWTFVLSYIGMIGFRVVVRKYLRRTRSQGHNQKRVVIVGAGKLGRRTCDTLIRETWAGLLPVALFDDDRSLVGSTHHGVQVRGTVDEVASYVEQQRRVKENGRTAIDQVWITLPLHAEQRISELQHMLQDTATNVYFIPNIFGFNLANYAVDEVVGLPVMNMSAPPMRAGNALVKRAEDLILASIMMVILSPLFVIIAGLIKLGSPGPVFFKQHRYGQDGREILVWKFRSMTVAENGNKVQQAQRDDKRVTYIGRWLRKLSLDELPQLINVLIGNMSLVGPRPHAVAHNEFYRTKVHGYMGRHKIRPGITGWAQVNGCRGETAKIRDMEERIRYDLEYIHNWSIPLDVRILFKTVRTVLDFKNTY